MFYIVGNARFSKRPWLAAYRVIMLFETRVPPSFDARSIFACLLGRFVRLGLHLQTVGGVYGTTSPIDAAHLIIERRKFGKRSIS